jgi:glycosyltransferase involved in cell wall biosynthesis
MRILFITQWYRPEPLTYQSDLAETLQAQGHEVCVLTGFPNWPTGKVMSGYRIKTWQREVLGGVQVIRVPLFPDHSNSTRRRVMNFSSFALSCACIAPWLMPRCDLVHCNFPPVTLGPPTWMLSRLMRAPMTFEVQDLWPETMAATGMVTNPRILKWVDRLAMWGYHRSAAIRVISPGFRDHLVEKGVPPDKIHVIPNWVDIERYKPRPADPRLAQELGLADRVNIMYAGTMGRAQGLDTLLEAAALLRDLSQVQFVLIGDGTELKNLKTFAAEQQLNNVKFLPRVSPEQIANYYPLAELMFVATRDDPLFRITIPHKIYAYMANGKPILGALAGNPAEVIQTSGAGVICPPGRPQALADAIRSFLTLTPEQRQALGRNGLRTVRKNYNRDLIVRQVEELFEETVKKHGARKRPLSCSM